MPTLHHLDKSKGTVKARTKIKRERDRGPEMLAILALQKTIEIMLNEDDKKDYPLNQLLSR